MSLMGEFAGMEDWDLQAIVRGCSNDFSTTLIETPQDCFAPFGIEQDNLDFTFPELFESTTIFDELEELYKPFYPVLQPLSPQTSLTSSISVPIEVKEPQEKQPLSGPTIVATAASTPTTRPKKGRKNQYKRVVQQVKVDALSSDMWAWRKYGQKPIKGSPYPRSYYRCSSLKGCPARKLVERSNTDPTMFIITYTAEHSHGHPTRRSSLAGSTRKNSSATKKTGINDPETQRVDECSCSSSISTAVPSPTSPLMGCNIEDEYLQHARKRERTIKECNDNIDIANLNMTSKDRIMGLDEFDEMTFDPDFDHWFSGQIPATPPC